MSIDHRTSPRQKSQEFFGVRRHPVTLGCQKGQGGRGDQLPSQPVRLQEGLIRDRLSGPARRRCDALALLTTVADACHVRRCNGGVRGRRLKIIN